MRTRLYTEQELINLLKDKDKKGFETLYNLYYKSLYGIALKIVHSQEIAEDVLQDSFIKIWKNIDSYDLSKGSLFTFMLNITRNTAIDRTRLLIYQYEEKGLSFSDGMVDKKTCFYQQVDYLGIEKCIKALSAQHQILIEYVYLKGYTHEETAKVLDIPLGTAKSRIKAAIGQLKLMMI